MANRYPLCDAQVARQTLLGEEAAKPPVKRSVREIAEERWGRGFVLCSAHSMIFRL
jgi:hypothetical protein